MKSSCADVSRRDACAVLGGAVAAAFGGLTGCSGTGVDSDSVPGFASDTEVKSYPLTVYLVIDSNLERGYANSDLGRVEEYFERYQSQTGREQVTFAVKYKTAEELASRAELGFDEGDAVIALQDTIKAATSKGTLYGGSADTSVRNFNTQLNETGIVFRATGSKVKMPKADTLTGEDSEDGQINRIQNLPKFKGKIAIANDKLTEGMLANKTLARWGFYSSESGTGGTYSEELANKIQVFDDLETMVIAVVNGECEIGFGVQSMLWGDFLGIEKLYDPSYSTIVYSGATAPDTESGGVARDFFEYVVQCS